MRPPIWDLFLSISCTFYLKTRCAPPHLWQNSAPPFGKSWIRHCKVKCKSATSASRMNQANIPEQIIKEVTGHRSDCVRVYNKTTDKMLQDASKTISGNVEQKSNGEVMRKIVVYLSQTANVLRNQYQHVKSLQMWLRQGWKLGRRGLRTMLKRWLVRF